MDNFPNFFIIGATKAGTTSLYFYLKQHPDIFMPSSHKEPHFFAFEPDTFKPGSRVMSIRNGRAHELSYVITNREAYLHLFGDATRERALGEASAMYIYLPGTAERIKAAVPNAKLIVMLRNPIDRAYSAYLHFIRDNAEPCQTFSEALEAEPRRIAEGWGPLYHYQNMGFYHRQLSSFFEHFSREQLHIIFYEDFQHSPHQVIQDVFRFLGVDSSFEADITMRYNATGIPQNKVLHEIRQFLQHPNRLKARAKQLLPPELRLALKRNIVARIETKNLKKPPLSEAAKDRLITVYRDDILALQDTLGRDLTHWLQ